MNFLKTCSFLFLLLYILPNYSLAQSDNDFWEEVGKYPIFSQHDITRSVLDYNTRRYVQKTETVYNTFHGFVLNSKGVMLGYKKEGNHARSPNFEPGVLFRSTDSGKTWKNISNKLPDVIPNPKNDFERSKNIYRKVIQSITVMDSIFFILQGTDFTDFRFLKSLDHGDTWISVSVNEVSPYVSLYPNKSCSNIKDDLLITSNFYNNSTFSGGSLIENTSADHGKTWKNVTNFSINKLFPDDKFMFWRAKEEGSWLSKQDWVSKHPNQNNLENVYTTPIYTTIDASFKNELYLLVEPKLFYPSSTINPKNLPKELIRSIDKGKTWERVETDGTIIEDIKLVDCSNTVYATLTKDPNGLYRSTDGGVTWELLKGIPNFPLFGAKMHIGSDGHLYVGVERVIYKSKNAVCCQPKPAEPEPDLIYGTTIITHDRMFHPAVINSYKTWMQRMAEAILEKARKGNIYVYNPITGKYTKVKSKGLKPEEGEQILIFDWAEESSIEASGYTGSAAQALYLSLTKLNIGKNKIPIDNVHFIGHGRGCIVNSLAIERLYQNENISIDQVTNIGPYERTFDMYYKNEHPEMFDDLYKLPALPPISSSNKLETERPYCGVIKWDDADDNNFDFSDTYWQANGKKYAYSLLKFATLGFAEIMVGRLEDINKQREIVASTQLNHLNVLLDDYEKSEGKQQEQNLFREIIDQIQLILGTFSQEDVKLLGKQLGWFLKILDLLALVDEIANSSFDSNPVQFTSNFYWSKYMDKTIYHESSTDPLKDYYGICDAYIESIKNAEFGKCTFNYNGNQGGYCFARLNGGKGLRNYYKGFTVPNTDYYQNLELSIENQEEINRIRSIYNGSFDRGKLTLPGWHAQGGEEEFVLPNTYPIIEIFKAIIGNENDCIYITNGEMHLTCYGCWETPTRVRQDRFLVPEDAKTISFQWKPKNVKAGFFNINIITYDENGNAKVNFIESKEIKYTSNQPNNKTTGFSEIYLDVKPYRNQIISLEFSFAEETAISNDDPYPKLIIDNVRLNKTDNVQKTVLESSSIESFDAENINLGIKNGTFETMNAWTTSAGKASLENATVALEPDEKNQAMTFTHQIFKVPDHTNFLNFLIQKSKLTKADIEVQIKDITTGEIETLYKEEVRISALGKINSELDKFNKALDSGTLDAYKKEFEQKRVNISKYKGKVVELSFIYLSLKRSCSKIFVDDIRLSN